jgi:hypothetical protein
MHSKSVNFFPCPQCSRGVIFNGIDFSLIKILLVKTKLNFIKFLIPECHVNMCAVTGILLFGMLFPVSLCHEICSLHKVNKMGIY